MCRFLFLFRILGRRCTHNESRASLAGKQLAPLLGYEGNPLGKNTTVQALKMLFGALA